MPKHNHRPKSPKVKHHTPTERLAMTRKKRKEGPSGMRRAARRKDLQRIVDNAVVDAGMERLKLVDALLPASPAHVKTEDAMLTASPVAQSIINHTQQLSDMMDDLIAKVNL